MITMIIVVISIPDSYKLLSVCFSVFLSTRPEFGYDLNAFLGVMLKIPMLVKKKSFKYMYNKS